MNVLVPHWIQRSVALGAFAWALGTAQPPTLTAQDSPATLTGFVVDSTYATISGVMVYLDSAMIIDWTDSLGGFELAGAAPGRHRIHFRKRGWNPQSYDFTLGSAAGAVDIGLIRLVPGSPPNASISGQAIDRKGTHPVAAAEVILNGRWIAQTDEDGLFQTDNLDVSWGSNLVTVRRVGYASVSNELWVDEVTSRFELTARLEQIAVTLPEVVVVGDSTVLAFGPMRDFWRRWRDGHGRFLIREDIEKSHASHTSDLFRLVPGVRVVSGGARTDILSARHGRPCRLDVYVDGILMVGDLDINVYTNPEWIEGIEIYTAASNTPPEFNRTTKNCGAIVIWTR